MHQNKQTTHGKYNLSKTGQSVVIWRFSKFLSLEQLWNKFENFKHLYRINVKKVSYPFDVPLKNVKSRATAKVYVFVLHIVNKQSNRPKTKAWHIIFIIQWIYIRGKLFTKKLPSKILHCFREHEYKCSRSTLTSSMHNFPITSLFEKLFRHERQVIFFEFSFF